MADNEPDHRDIEERKFELEEKKLNLEERKLHVETSFAKNYSAAIVSAFVTISVAIISFTQAYIAREDRLKADERTQLLATADQNRQVGQWGVSILELYFSHPDGFDPAKSPDTAQQNLTALAVSAPDIMKPILQQRQHDLVRMGAAGAAGTGETLSVVANALQGPRCVTTGPAKARSLKCWPQESGPIHSHGKLVRATFQTVSWRSGYRVADVARQAW